MELHQRHWVKKVESWKESGLTKTEFCRREGINRGTFSTWWRRYKAQIEKNGSGGFVEVSSVAEVKSKREQNGGEYPVEISAGGFSVKINSNADSILIEKIFKALETRLCL